MCELEFRDDSDRNRTKRRTVVVMMMIWPGHALTCSDLLQSERRSAARLESMRYSRDEGHVTESGSRNRRTNMHEVIDHTVRRSISKMWRKHPITALV